MKLVLLTAEQQRIEAKKVETWGELEKELSSFILRGNWAVASQTEVHPNFAEVCFIRITDDNGQTVREVALME